jgi:hypothetical protein
VASVILFHAEPWESEARADDGRWTSGGGSSAAGASDPKELKREHRKALSTLARIWDNRSPYPHLESPEDERIHNLVEQVAYPNDDEPHGERIQKARRLAKMTTEWADQLERMKHPPDWDSGDRVGHRKTIQTARQVAQHATAAADALERLQKHTETFCGGPGGKPGPCPEGGHEQPHASWLQRARSLPRATLDRAAGVVQKRFRQLERRYGRKWAVAIIGAGLAGVPVPLPGSSVLTALPVIAVAELHRQLSGQATHEEERGEQLTPEQIQALGRRFLADLQADFKVNQTFSEKQTMAIKSPAMRRLRRYVEDGDRSDMIQRLTELGYSRDVLETMDTDQLAECFRVHGQDDFDEYGYGPENTERMPPRAKGAPPERTMSERRARKHDENSHVYPGGPGHLLDDPSTDQETEPRWDSTRGELPRKMTFTEAKRKWAENQIGLRQMGFKSAEHFRAVMCGEQEHPLAQLPKEAPEARSLADKAEKYSERDRSAACQYSQSFSEGRLRQFGTSRAELQRIFLAATPEQQRDMMTPTR